MSYFKAKIHQNRYILAGGAYSALPDLLAGFNRSYFYGGNGRRRRGEEKGRGKRGEKGA